MSAWQVQSGGGRGFKTHGRRGSVVVQEPLRDYMTSPKVPLKPWHPYRVWRNHTTAEQKRTITLFPCAGVETFPPGCVITVFEAAETNNGGPPASAGIQVGPKGDSVGFSVQPGNAVFVHFDQGTTPVNSVLADISQEP